MPAPSLALRQALAALSSLLLFGCHLLVTDDLGAIRCAEDGVEGPPACPQGQICTSGRCVAGEGGAPTGVGGGAGGAGGDPGGDPGGSAGRLSGR